uniref:C2H2-type domain-containing protein n=1 Tax=viral metagenome TaxID=1070528 RepID=A0A6C0LR70_9ZZZZ
MPKTEIDYSNTIIYKITCKDPTVKDVYVGHTTNFVQRKHAHKQSCTNNKSSNYDCKLYEVIRNNGGWNNWFMEIVGFFNCNDHYEARKKEQEYFELLRATLNSIEPMPKPKPKIANGGQLSEKNEYYCEICKVKFQNSKCMDIHNQSKKHIKKQNNVSEQTSDNNTDKYQNDMNCFSCINCNYNTNHKSHYNKHLSSIKHRNNEKELQKNEEASLPSYTCSCNKIFNHRQNLHRHKKTCKGIDNNEVIEPKNTISNDLILEFIKQSKEIQNFLIEQNKDLQNKLLDIVNIIHRKDSK